MKLIQGVWLPDGETHMIEVMTGPKARVVDGVITYQYRKLERALGFIPADRRRRCIDIGGHVGTWSMHLKKHFRTVEAFEPVAAHRECFVKNAGFEPHPFALGDKEGRVGMREVPSSTGSAHVAGEGEIEMRTLDSFGFTEVDFIKIDVEGLELQVCKGGATTIFSNQPYMVVEQKGREVSNYQQPERDAAVQFLQRKLGMKALDCISGDWILGW